MFVRISPVMLGTVRIQGLKADYPFWGYRRIWARLRFGDGVQHI